jgi:AbrB family looped-hinge helix DNA binding protein
MSSESESEESTTVTVTVSKNGQATIPKKFREKLGIDAPGRVMFRELEDGTVQIESVASPAEMRGFAARAGDSRASETPLSEELREKRDADKEEREER